MKTYQQLWQSITGRLMLSISLAWNKIGKPYSDFPKNTFGGR